MSKTYTLAEAAAQLGLREEALAPMLPGLGASPFFAPKKAASTGGTAAASCAGL